MRGARRAKARSELRTKIKSTAIFVKCLCGNTYNAHFKVEPKAVMKGDVGMSCLIWRMLCRQILPIIGKSYNLSGDFTTCFISVNFIIHYGGDPFSVI